MIFNEPNIASPKKRLWMAAIKPPMYSVAIMPIWVGSAIAVAVNKTFNQTIFIVFLISAISILAWENISNDVFDSQTGIDQNKLHSVVNLVGRADLVFWISNCFLSLGIVGISWISWTQQDPMVLLLVLICCLLGYVYQGPPFRLGYWGLGEPICFVCFGPLAVTAAYYSQTQTWSWTSFAASIVVGIATTLILFCSHFDQVKDDLAAGKLSPVARLGTWRSAQLLPWFCGSIYVFTALFAALKIFPVWTLLSFFSLPFAIQLSNLLNKHHNEPEKIRHSRFIAVSLHFWSSLLLGLGFAIVRIFAG